MNNLTKKILLPIVRGLFCAMVCFYSSSTFAKFTSKNPQWQKWLKDLPELTLPQGFPLAKNLKKQALKRPLKKDEAQKYICTLKTFDCKLKEQGTQFFRSYHITISDEVLAVVYVSLGNQDTQTVLVTYNQSAQPLAAVVLSASYGDFEWGYEGQIRTDKTLVQNRYVWVQAKDKEFAESKNFKIKSDGLIEFIIK